MSHQITKARMNAQSGAEYSTVAMTKAGAWGASSNRQCWPQPPSRPTAESRPTPSAIPAVARSEPVAGNIARIVAE
jgi:hypothetical protein